MCILSQNLNKSLVPSFGFFKDFPVQLSKSCQIIKVLGGKISCGGCTLNCSFSLFWLIVHGSKILNDSKLQFFVECMFNDSNNVYQ